MLTIYSRKHCAPLTRLLLWHSFNISRQKTQTWNCIPAATKSTSTVIYTTTKS